MRCERIVYLFSFGSLLSHCDCGGGGAEFSGVWESNWDYINYNYLVRFWCGIGFV